MWQTLSIYYRVIRNKITPQQFSSLFLTDRELAHNPHGLYGPYELLVYSKFIYKDIN